jgi:hypothetical protein
MRDRYGQEARRIALARWDVRAIMAALEIRLEALTARRRDIEGAARTPEIPHLGRSAPGVDLAHVRVSPARLRSRR